MLRPDIRAAVPANVDEAEARRLLSGQTGHHLVQAILCLLIREYDDSSAIASAPAALDRAHATGQMFGIAQATDRIADALAITITKNEPPEGEE